MIGYKGFDRDFCCRGFQFAVGETFAYDSELKLCKSGFHFCTNPLAVFEFYPPVNGNRFALVETGDNVIFSKRSDYKACTDKLTIVKELSLHELIFGISHEGNRLASPYSAYRSAVTDSDRYSFAMNTGFKSVVADTGECSAVVNTGSFSAAMNTSDYSVTVNNGYTSIAANTGSSSVVENAGNRSTSANLGYNSVAINIGNHSTAINTGSESAAIVSGNNSIALVTGRCSKAKGALGCWLVLTEYDDNNVIDVRVDVQVFKVDGDKIKPDTFYRLQSGKPVEVND